MNAYVTVDLTVKNAEKLSEYGSQAPDTFIEFGGEFIAKGAIEALHGEAVFTTKVIIRFPDKAKAVGWYNSKAYQEIIPTRDEAFDSQFHLVD